MRRHRVLLTVAVLIFAGIGAVTTIGGPNHPDITQGAEPGPYLTQLFEYKFNVNGEEIQLPVSFMDLKNRGWSIQEPGEWSERYHEEQIVNGFDMVIPTLYKGGADFYTFITNGEPVQRRIVDLDITNLTFSVPIDGEKPEIVLPGDIVIGKSTLTELIAAYGKPTMEQVGDGARYYAVIYEMGDNRSIYFSYHTDEIINVVAMTNEGELYRKGMEYLSNIQPSAEAQAYTAPSSLGTDITKMVFSYMGDVYQFPAPLTAFIDKGWKIEQRSLNTYYLNPGEETSVDLERGGIRRYVTVRNNGTEKAPIQNCFTTYITDYIMNDLVLPKGLQMGISRSSLMKIVNGLNFTVEDNWKYTVKDTDSNNEIIIFIDDDENKVSQVMISSTK